MKNIFKIRLTIICCSFFLFMSVLCLVGLPSPEAAHGQFAEDAISKVKESVMSYFTPLSGSVEGSEDGQVKLSIHDGGIPKKGMRFSVYRKGDPFYHPVTQELIGNREDHRGRIEVMEKVGTTNVYTCKVVNGDIQKDDIARISASKIKLAFFQDRKADWLLSETFYKALKDSGRFDILETYTPTYNPSDLANLARELGAEAVLVLSTPVEAGRKLMKVRLYWVNDAGMFAAIEEELAEGYVKAIKPEDDLISVQLIDTEPWGSYDLADGKLIAVGDVDGNNRDEIVISDGTNITVYDFQEDLRELWSIQGDKSGRHISLDVLDLNKNGIDEIFITSVDNGTEIRTDDIQRSRDGMSIQSFVIEYDAAEGYRTIKDNIPYFLRVNDDRLFMQGFHRQRIFDGPVWQGLWSDGDYRTDKTVSLPAGVNIYGFTFVDWKNQGQVHIMSFNDTGYLTLYDANGETLWKSENSYGKFDTSFETETQSVAHPEKKWAVRGRLMAVQTSRGQEVIALKRVPIVAQVPGLGPKGAEVSALWWDGDVMDETVFLSGVSGNITDYWLRGSRLFLVARGSVFSFAKKAITGEFAKGSMLYYFNFTKK